MNPLELRGPAFLGLYAGLLLLLFIVRLIPGVLARNSWSRTDAPCSPGPYELAWLAGGRRAVLGAIILALQKGELLNYRGGLITRLPGTKASQAALEARPQLERDLYHALVRKGRLTKGNAQNALRGRLEQLEDALMRSGFATTRTWQSITVWLGRLGPFTLIVFGVLKTMIGIERQRPVTFLILLLVATAISMIWLWHPVRVTPQGRDYLGLQREGNDALRLTASSNPSALTTDELLSAYGLFGVVPVAFGLTDFYAPRYAPRGIGDGVNAGSSWTCSGSSCGSGGSCGGGCGGGCGGCGS